MFTLLKYRKAKKLLNEEIMKCDVAYNTLVTIAYDLETVENKNEDIKKLSSTYNTEMLSVDAALAVLLDLKELLEREVES